MFLVMLIASLLGAVLVHLLVPAASPLLEEACRGPQRARFWTRLLALAILLVIPVGVLLAFVMGEHSITWLDLSVDQDDPSAFAGMLRTGWQFGGLLIAAFALGIFILVPDRGAEGKSVESGVEKAHTNRDSGGAAVDQKPAQPPY